MSEANILRDAPIYLRHAVDSLQQLKEQVGEIDSIDQARAAVQAKLDAATEELKVRRGEVKEVEWQRDQILKAAREDLAKNEHVKAENKRLTAANAALEADLKTNRGKIAEATKVFAEEVQSAIGAAIAQMREKLGS